MRQIRIDPNFESWQRAAKWLLLDQTPPHHVEWIERGAEQASLFALAEEFTSEHPGTLSVPRPFVEIAQTVACHRGPHHWDRMYRVLWRLLHEDRNLLHISVDPDVRALFDLQQEVRLDSQRMQAFVRFRELKSEQRFIAWYRPDHRVTRRVAPGFIRRFKSMRWSILTPDECVHWDDGKLRFTAGVIKSGGIKSSVNKSASRESTHEADHVEDLWREYYRSTFNPARVNEALMRQHMPARVWEHMPEAEVVRDVLANSAQRVQQMLKDQTLTDKSPRRTK
jgi:DNA polymerase